MKPARSFSLLTFLLLATVAAIGIALYSANAEVAQKRADFKAYSEELGFIDVEDESKIHVRKLGGYPQLSFAFRYQLPKDAEYELHIGSGVVDPDSGLPPILTSRTIGGEDSQNTLVINLVKMPTPRGLRWTTQTIVRQQLRTEICDNPHEFTWLQTYLAAFPTEGHIGSHFQFDMSTEMAVEGHSPVSTFAADDAPILYSKGEYHPSAIATLTPELLKKRRTFVIWLEPIKPPSETSGLREDD